MFIQYVLFSLTSKKVFYLFSFYSNLITFYTYLIKKERLLLGNLVMLQIMVQSLKSSTSKNYHQLWMIDYHRKDQSPFVCVSLHYISSIVCRPFKQKMNQLLVSLLKLDPLERMTFPEFFDFTDDLIKSKVEVINLLHGTSFKFMMETGMK